MSLSIVDQIFEGIANRRLGTQIVMGVQVVVAEMFFGRTSLLDN